jgi:nicotinate-nucleotide adenylyltransferase
MRRLICLFGGTFDPVHYGHLKPLNELQQYLAADAVHVLPASFPPHRSAPLASSEQRQNMLQLALREYPGFILDSRELERSGPSWTVLTLQSFRQQYPDASLCLVMGSDAFNGLSSWYHWQQIPQLANIIVIERAGMETAKRPDWATEHLVRDVDSLRESKSSSILFVSLKGYDISATEIRQRMAQKLDVTGMLPDKVIDYIRQNGIYQA